MCILCTAYILHAGRNSKSSMMVWHFEHSQGVSVTSHDTHLITIPGLLITATCQHSSPARCTPYILALLPFTHFLVSNIACLTLTCVYSPTSYPEILFLVLHRSWTPLHTRSIAPSDSLEKEKDIAPQIRLTETFPFPACLPGFTAPLLLCVISIDLLLVFHLPQ